MRYSSTAAEFPKTDRKKLHKPLSESVLQTKPTPPTAQGGITTTFRCPFCQILAPSAPLPRLLGHYLYELRYCRATSLC